MAPGTPSGCFIVGHDMMVAFHRESQFLLSRRTNRSMVSHFENDQLFRQGRRTMAKAALHIAILAIAVTLSSAGEGRYQLGMFQKESWSKSLQASGWGKASSGFARFFRQEPSPLSSLHTRSEGKGISNKHQRKYRRLEFITLPLINERGMAKVCKIQANGKYMNIISHQCNDREMFQVCKKDDGCPSNCIAKGQHCETIREER